MNSQTDVINDWYPETRSLLERLENAGFELISADNGEDGRKYNGPGDDMVLFIDTLTACDEAWLRVRKDCHDFRLYLVYGNSPGELVADYSYPANKPEVEKLIYEVTSAHYEEWVDKPQPKANRTYNKETGEIITTPIGEDHVKTAAPYLLAALKGLMGCHDSGYEKCTCDKCIAAERAIRLAQGETTRV